VIEEDVEQSWWWDASLCDSTLSDSAVYLEGLQNINVCLEGRLGACVQITDQSLELAGYDDVL